MARPKGPERKQIQLKIDVELCARLDEVSDERVLGRNLIVERALRDLFEKLEGGEL